MLCSTHGVKSLSEDCRITFRNEYELIVTFIQVNHNSFCSRKDPVEFLLLVMKTLTTVDIDLEAPDEVEIQRHVFFGLRFQPMFGNDHTIGIIDVFGNVDDVGRIGRYSSPG
jgi:hypothetical protein